MAHDPGALREFFHLTFLRQFSDRLAGRAYAVKGGACLRFFHRSARLSEDMDLDVQSRIGLQTLRKAVDVVLESRPFLSHLASQGVTGVSATKPKQTPITQRWKVTLQLPGGPVQTKIEFSRRSSEIPYERGVPGAEILSRYHCAPFAVQFYPGEEMARQKIGALAATSRHAVRDVFDLHHLVYGVGVNVAVVTGGMDKKVVEAAIEKIEGFSFKDFKAEVWPYLTEEIMAAYATAPSFERMKDATSGKLLETLS